VRKLGTRARVASLMAGAWVLLGAACSANQESSGTPPAASAAPGAATAQSQLSGSPRHGEWVMVSTGPGDSVRAWLVYPERKGKAPVVVVVHEIFGLSNWVRSVADQLAADGFIAIAPDLLTKFNVPNTPDGEPNPDSARARIATIRPEQYQPQIRKVAEFAMSLPAATKKYGVVGYCWGGGAVFAHAVRFPDVNAVVSYYGTTPAPADYASVKAPVLGLYGENDARVNATIARADSAARQYRFVYEPHIFPGAGHGFLRAQDGQNGANRAAAQQAWPLTVEWFRKYLGS
ncbi:MAG TPA: dienelactone hydrolase family protein, partial [Longimicrobiales bacterium]